jgi:hypothetical protein
MFVTRTLFVSGLASTETLNSYCTLTPPFTTRTSLLEKRITEVAQPYKLPLHFVKSAHHEGNRVLQAFTTRNIITDKSSSKKDSEG